MTEMFDALRAAFDSGLVFLLLLVGLAYKVHKEYEAGRAEARRRGLGPKTKRELAQQDPRTRPDLDLREHYSRRDPEA